MEKSTNTTISRIKSAMRDQRLTQAELLKRAAIYCDELHIRMNKSDLSQFLSGKVNPGYAKVLALSRALGVNERWLLGEADDPTPVLQMTEQSDDDGMNTGARIKARRQELGLSVDELASKIGKNRATVYRYENGEVENVPWGAIEALSEALKTTPVDLIGWPNEMDDRAPGDTATADTAKRGEDNTESAFRLQRYKVPDFSPKSTMIRLSPEDYHYLTVLSVATGMKKQQVLHEMVQFCKNRCVIED